MTAPPHAATASDDSGSPPAAPTIRPAPPVLGRLLRGSFWLVLRSPLQMLLALWSVPLILKALGPNLNGAYYFAWGFGFLQFLLEFGMSSALQRQIADCWTRGDRAGVERSIACGTTFYAALSVVQAAALILIAYYAVPHSGYAAEPYRTFVVRLLWLQAITAPCFGLSTVVSSVLQAARRYDFIPRLELAVVVLRFVVLIAGVNLGVDFLWIVVTQVVIQIGLSLGPALGVMVGELGYRPHFSGARREDFAALVKVSAYVFLIQLSVVLADKLDKAVLAFALTDPGPPTSVYEFVGKAFVQIRQTGWMLSYLVMPAAASLIAARDHAGLERLEYDGSRYLIGLLTPIVLPAAFFAGPFLAAWVGPKYAENAWLMRLYLVATAPLVISVLVQTAIGMGKVRPIALAALAGAAVNLPLSYVLTLRSGDASGVIWGTVLTTLFSNLLVPGVYVFRTLGIDPGRFVLRTLGPPLAGAAALSAACAGFSRVVPPTAWGPSRLDRWAPLGLNVAVGVAAYIMGYVLTPTGRGDLRLLAGKLRSRLG